jgi:predicted nucleic acid-binding protein
MVPFDRFAVVLDACTMFPMLVRDGLLTLASHEFYSPKWSPRIREEWTRNLIARMSERDDEVVARSKVERIAAAVEAAFPDALVTAELPESPTLDPVDAKDRHVVVTAMVAQADAIVTFNLADFAAAHLSETLQIEVIHPDDFVMDLVDLNEKRAVAAFRELRARKQNPPMDSVELIRRLRNGGLVQTSLWLNTRDVVELI